jgi:hypothetical protein
MLFNKLRLHPLKRQKSQKLNVALANHPYQHPFSTPKLSGDKANKKTT